MGIKIIATMNWCALLVCFGIRCRYQVGSNRGNGCRQHDGIVWSLVVYFAFLRVVETTDSSHAAALCLQCSTDPMSSEKLLYDSCSLGRKPAISSQAWLTNCWANGLDTFIAVSAMALCQSPALCWETFRSSSQPTCVVIFVPACAMAAYITAAEKHILWLCKSKSTTAVKICEVLFYIYRSWIFFNRPYSIVSINCQQFSNITISFLSHFFIILYNLLMMAFYNYILHNLSSTFTFIFAKACPPCSAVCLRQLTNLSTCTYILCWSCSVLCIM